MYKRLDIMDKFEFPKNAKNTYVLRSTNEEVEVTSFHQVYTGERSEDDWVTYIDSNGVEHIKEHLNIELDFKMSEVMFKFLEEMFKPTRFESKPIKFPYINISRRFDLAKELFINGDSINNAIDNADRFVTAFTERFKDDDE